MISALEPPEGAHPANTLAYPSKTDLDSFTSRPYEKKIVEFPQLLNLWKFISEASGN
jgi:hypothetical protein